MIKIKNAIPRFRALLCAGFATMALLTSVQPAQAAEEYLTEWQNIYPNSTSETQAGRGGCQICHGRPNEGGRIGPDLGKIAWRTKDEEEFANRMLRHAPHMLDIAKKAGLIWPTLKGHQIVNIFAYLQALETTNQH